MKKINIVLTTIILLGSLQPLIALAQTQDDLVIETNQEDSGLENTIVNNDTSQTISTESNNANSSGESLTSVTETTTDSSLAKAVEEDSVLQEEKTTEPSNLLADTIASGTFGTSEWTIDTEGTLHIGAGEFEESAAVTTPPWTDYGNAIKNIIFDGKVIANSHSGGLFYALQYVTEIQNINLLDTSNVTNMSYMFCSMPDLKKLDLSSFDTSNVMDMSYMFATSGIESLDLSNFDMAKVQGTENIFIRTKSLKKLILGPKVTLSSNNGLKELSSGTQYTGKWINVGTGSVTSPAGSNIWTSTELMANYYGETDADTYVWQRTTPAQNITIHYIDESGKQIADSVTLSGNVGEAYTSEQKDVEGYTFKEVQGDATGTFSDTAQTVSYVYTKDAVKGADITVKYVDTDGDSLLADVVKTGNIGDKYTTEQKKIDGYTFKEVKGNANGTFTDKAQTVTYVYKDNTKVSVIVHDSKLTVGDAWHAEDNFDSATDYSGNAVPFSDMVVEGQVDTTKSGTYKVIYQINIPTLLLNYENVGTYSAVATITVVDAVKGGDVTSTYEDADGNKIADDVVKTGNVGDSYTTEKKSIDGYTFKEVQGDATGTFSDTAQTVTYVYTKDAVVAKDVTVNYTDEDGKQIADPITLSGNIGETYSSEQKVIEGYTFKEVQGDATGPFSDTAQMVTYVYTKNSSPVTSIQPSEPSLQTKTTNSPVSFPQTGERLTIMSSLIGSILIILGGSLYLFKKKEKCN
ncbi:MucBP domain-containing protein [Listeria monocytogenes]|nr:MucBP domain-containing protein [Listeria monocytogenes]